MPRTPPSVDRRLARLEEVISAYGPCVTAFSGGVDSTLVAVVSARVHGARALAVTGVSPSLSAREREQAEALAQQLGITHIWIATDELARAGYRANAGDRCYHCKTELFERLGELARVQGLAAVLSGDNLDDLGEHRPGLRAAAELGVGKPLIEAGLTKADVRALAQVLGLPNHDKPAAPCLASRVPHGVAVDLAVLAVIERAEAAVRALGFQRFRVRHHGEVARLELAAGELARALELREPLVEALQAAGYRWAALDLGGFRSGSLNIVLDAGSGRR